MSNREQIQDVQQQICSVVQEASEVKVTLAAAEQADTGTEVEHLRKRLERLERKEIVLREKKNLLMKGQQEGEPSSCMTSTI